MKTRSKTKRNVRIIVLCAVGPVILSVVAVNFYRYETKEFVGVQTHGEMETQ